ncbi:hypothetical protein POTOM_042920 [Populus tomentosa]|uniref:Uncharacterized protein n=1 Tax=Populus tomentosa TaxID=118781 RepID=A0A8X7YN43_POPTO|nr:hypothetical protein POTOM_042920 [Populus tomentosa]
MAGETRLNINNLRTTMQIIKQTTATFNTNFFTLILLALLLFTFRTLIENGTRNLTRDASLDSFFSRLDLADRNYRRLHPLRPTFDRDDPFTGKDNADSFSLFTLPSNGIVFVVVANDLLGRHDSCISEVVWVGAKVGVKKLTWFFCLRWAVRNAESHGIGLLFVPRIYDRYMPMYFLLWWALDEVVALVMALDCWITIDSSRRTGFEIMREGYDLISRMWHQAVLIKCYEHVIVEGTAARYHLSRVLGEGSASIFQLIFAVYFTVAWVIVYLVTRCKEADSGGRRLGRKELEGLIDGLK